MQNPSIIILLFAYLRHTNVIPMLNLFSKVGGHTELIPCSLKRKAKANKKPANPQFEIVMSPFAFQMFIFAWGEQGGGG